MLSYQIVYAAATLGMIAALALPVGAVNRNGCDDYTNPLCVPAGATEGDEQSGGTIRGSGR